LQVLDIVNGRTRNAIIQGLTDDNSSHIELLATDLEPQGVRYRLNLKAG
jgi:hypothetical protein